MERRKHPFVAALLRDRVTVAEVAKDLGRSPSAVKSWYKAGDDDHYRPIPRDVAVRLRARFRVPLTAWHRIAD